MPQISFGLQSYRDESLPLSAQRMMNCYLEPAPPKSKTIAAVKSFFGIKSLSTIGTGPFRGGIAVNNTMYVVSGSQLFKVDSDGAGTALGTIPGTDLISIAADEINVMVVSQRQGYVYNGSTVQQITDPDFPGADWVVNFDGYYIVGEPDSGEFALSANRNPLSWDALDFGSAEKYPDNIIGAIVQLGEIAFLGVQSGEIWIDSGAPDLAISKSDAGIWEVGIMSKFAVVKADNTFFFLGADGIVYRLNGYTPQRVSQPAIEQAIKKAADKNFRMLSWAENGHTFVGLFSADMGFVYDCFTQLWCERISFGRNTWRAAFVLLANHRLYVGDTESNKFGELSPDTFSDFDDVLRMSCTAPALSQDNLWIFLDRLELVFEQGVGTLSTVNPQVTLTAYDHGGRVKLWEKDRSLGAMGDFKQMVVFTRGGRSRDMVLEYAITDKVRRTLILATADTRVGTH